MSAKRWVSASVYSQLAAGSRRAVAEDKEQRVWDPACKGPHSQLPSGVVRSAGQSQGKPEWVTWGVQQPERPRQRQLFHKENKPNNWTASVNFVMCSTIMVCGFKNVAIFYQDGQAFPRTAAKASRQLCVWHCTLTHEPTHDPNRAPQGPRSFFPCCQWRSFRISIKEVLSSLTRSSFT